LNYGTVLSRKNKTITPVLQLIYQNNKK